MMDSKLEWYSVGADSTVYIGDKEEVARLLAIEEREDDGDITKEQFLAHLIPLEDVGMDENNLADDVYRYQPDAVAVVKAAMEKNQAWVEHW